MKWYYFVDKCLPFGSSISCAQFQAFSNALKHIAEWKLQITLSLSIPPALTNYLDDFLFITISRLLCNDMMWEFIELCEHIGCPIAPEKTEWGTTLIILLGILLNGKFMKLPIPLEKQVKAIHLIQTALSKKKVTIHFIQKLTGTLNFLNRVIVPGCAFTKGMYKRLTLKYKFGIPLKKHHHVNLNKEFLQDCKVWLQFLTNADNVRLCCPFLDFSGDNNSQILNFTTDASKNPLLGMGAIFNNRWLMQQWPTKFVQDVNPSIEYLELFALTAALLRWRQDKDLRNACITIFCNNESVVYMVNKLGSTSSQCMKLLRIIALESITWNRKVIVRHIRSKENFLADSLSRLDLKQFKKLAPESMNKFKDEIDNIECIWPMEKLWFNSTDYLPTLQLQMQQNLPKK